jgi:hypothetical protein
VGTLEHGGGGDEGDGFGFGRVGGGEGDDGEGGEDVCGAEFFVGVDPVDLLRVSIDSIVV